MKNISNKDTFEKREEKKLFIETYGCQMNVADSEVVASIMQMAGYTLCDTIETPMPYLSIPVPFGITPSKRSFRDCPIFNRCVNIRNLW